MSEQEEEISKQVLHGDWPRSYLRKQGKITRGQKRALRELWDTHGLDCPHGVVLEPEQIFGRSAPCVLEVGFGMGENLLAQALAHPEKDFLGVEVHRPGLGLMLTEIQRRELTNVKVIRRDVIKLLKDHLPADCVDEVYLFFPEPWPRDKDVGRRLVRPLVLDLLAQRMRAGSAIHLATDVAEYAAHVIEVFGEDERWVSQSPDESGLVERAPWRPLTKYEQKGLDEGRSIHDLRYLLVQKS